MFKINNSNSADPNELMDLARTSIYESARASINDIYEKLVLDEDNSPKGRIDERTFVNVFLPYLFAGKKQPPNTPEKYKINIDKWITLVSKTPFNAVDVYDNATGEVLYTVPPVFTTDCIDIKTESGDSYNRVIANGLMLQRNNPSSVVNDYVVNGLASTLGQQSRNVNTARYDAVWKSIFDRYNIVPEPNILPNNNNTSKTETKKEVVENKASEEEELVFDDF